MCREVVDAVKTGLHHAVEQNVGMMEGIGAAQPGENDGISVPGVEKFQRRGREYLVVGVGVGKAGIQPVETAVLLVSAVADDGEIKVGRHDGRQLTDGQRGAVQLIRALPQGKKAGMDIPSRRKIHIDTSRWSGR